MNDIKLASFRPESDENSGRFKTMRMTREEMASRRCFIRGLLKGTIWEKLKNDQLDQITLSPCGDSWILEDADFYQYVLK